MSFIFNFFLLFVILGFLRVTPFLFWAQPPSPSLGPSSGPRFSEQPKTSLQASLFPTRPNERPRTSLHASLFTASPTTQAAHEARLLPALLACEASCTGLFCMHVPRSRTPCKLPHLLPHPSSSLPPGHG